MPGPQSQWRRLFGKDGMHGLEQGLTFKEWQELGFPRVPLRPELEGTVKPRVLRSLFLGAHTVDDQLTAYMRSGTVIGRMTSDTSALEEIERKH